eukprot:1382866-Alexandrium_andersonii.AAC.1
MGEELAAGTAPAERLRFGRGTRPSSPGGGFRRASGHGARVIGSTLSVRNTGTLDGTSAPLPGKCA